MAKAELEKMQTAMFDKAKKFREDNTLRMDAYKDFVELMKSEDNKFVLAHWDGSRETEAKVKADCGATIRCLPLPGQGFEDEPGACMVSGKPSERRVIWAKAY